MNEFLIEWKRLAHEKKLTRYDMALYCISKALRKEDSLKYAKIYLSKAFTPVTKQIKLDNGAMPYWSTYDAIHYGPKSWFKCVLSTLIKTISEEDKLKIIAIAEKINIGYGKVDLL